MFDSGFGYKISTLTHTCRYSALLIGDTWDKLVVASGTVFNQVALWKPSTEHNATERCAVQKRLTGHQVC